MNVSIQSLTNNAILPTYGSSESAGIDLYAALEEPIDINQNEVRLIPTNIAVEIPSGYFGMVCSRSGLSLKNGIFVLNSPGIIDADYRGEINVILSKITPGVFRIENHMKVAQLIIAKFEKIEWNKVDSLSKTDRGEHGFGSTGV